MPKEMFTAIYQKLYPTKLKTKMILLIVSLILFLVITGGALALHFISSLVEEQIGSRALAVSQTVSRIPQIIADLEKGDLETSSIQTIAEKIRLETGAQFIVVGDKDGKRFSHPIEERLGHFMVGGDNRRAIEGGESYVSKATGTLGPSIRGKVPVFNSDGSIVGLVSTGYLMANIRSLVWGYHLKILAFLVAALLIGIFFTLRITKNFQKAIFDLEPAEIAAVLQERTTTLETIREGVLAVDSEGKITTINQAAFKTLNIEPDAEAVGKPVTEVFPQTRILEVLHSGESQLDKLLHVDDKEIIVNRIPIKNDRQITGVVSSFRDKDELDKLARKLSQVEKYSEMLRAQTHEYSNKLHTISGLIQIGASQEAVELIGSETSGYQELITSLVGMVSDPTLAGAILGKYNRAKELKIDFMIDENSSMLDIPKNLKREKLLTTVGNILDNSFDAVLKNKQGQRKVRLAMTDLGKDLIFDFDDSGPGIDASIKRSLFLKGFSTKEKQGHGMGLFLVEKAVRSMKGTICFGESELGGASFTVILPKETGALHG